MRFLQKCLLIGSTDNSTFDVEVWTRFTWYHRRSIYETYVGLSYSSLLVVLYVDTWLMINLPRQMTKWNSWPNLRKLKFGYKLEKTKWVNMWYDLMIFWATKIISISMWNEQATWPCGRWGKGWSNYFYALQPKWGGSGESNYYSRLNIILIFIPLEYLF